MSGPVQFQFPYHFKLGFTFFRKVFLVVRFFSLFGYQCFGLERLKLYQISSGICRGNDHFFSRGDRPVMVDTGFGNDDCGWISQFLMTWFDSTSLFKVKPAPITQLLPIEIQCFVTTPLPIKHSFPTVTSPFTIAPVAMWQ